MANLMQTRIFGNAVGNAGSTITAKAGSGFSNLVVLNSNGTTSVRTWFFPAALQVPDAKFKVTILGAGGQGGGSTAGSWNYGGGGGSGSLAVIWMQVIQGFYEFDYVIGQGGSTGTSASAGAAGTVATQLTYVNSTYSAGVGSGGPLYVSTGDVGGAGGTFVAPSTVDRPNWKYLSINGGRGGGPGQSLANYSIDATGSDSPFGLGLGGPKALIAAGGSAATGYGAGGGGASNGIGGAGGDGLILIEY